MDRADNRLATTSALIDSLSGDVASKVVGAAADLAMLIDGEGTITDVMVGDAVHANQTWTKLVGRLWSDSVLRDSQPKVAQLLAEARSGQKARSREINLKMEGGAEIPFRFSAVGVAPDRQDASVIVVGRDLQALSKAQQQLVSSQQAMDREYGRLRQVDARYRLLFHVSSEGVVVGDSTTLRILEANPAAATLLGEAAQSLQGKVMSDLFEPASQAAVQAMISALDAGAKPADVTVHLRGSKERQAMVSASLFRQAGATLVLLRFWPTDTGAIPSSVARASRMVNVLEAMPEGFVVTGEDLRILCANTAFCELVEQANENQVVGEQLDRWLGRPGVDLNIMLANMREHTTVRNFATIVKSDFGPAHEALVTGVSALDGKVPCLGFTIRVVSARSTTLPSSAIVPRSVEQLRELVGRVSLKELVRESADLIERLCIEAALDVSGNNRASAAQLLGLSRQGLYSKLRRHGLAEFDPEQT